MRLLIIGGSGFVGRGLSAALRDRHGVTIASRHRPEWADEYGVQWVSCDITDRTALAHALGNVSVDVVVDLVGLIDEKEQRHNDVNVGGTANIVELLKGTTVKLVYFSAINSEHGTTQYFSTKRAAEANVGTHENHVIIRPSMLYGEHDHIVTQLSDMARGFVPGLPRSGILCPVYIGDMATVFERLLGETGSFNVCSEERLSLGDMFNMIRRKLGKRPVPQLPRWLFYPVMPVLSSKGLMSMEQLAMLGHDFFRQDTVLPKYVPRPKRFEDFVDEYVR
jgi:nucleoside-diphosphate-sugar epimerase